VRAVRKLIEAGELGDLYFVTSSRVNLGLHQRDVSVIWDLGPHDFSILLYWLGGPPSTIRATGRDSIVPGIADVAFVTMEFPSGVIANVELSWLAPSKLRRTVLVGSKKMIVYEDGAAERSGSSIAASCTRTRDLLASTTSPTAPATSSRPSLRVTSPSRCSARSSSAFCAPAGRLSTALRCRATSFESPRPAEASLEQGGAQIEVGERDLSYVAG